MKIVRIRTLIVGAGMRNWIFVRVETDRPGLYGWGEATLEWKTRSVAAAVEDLSELILGEDATHITRCMQRLSKGGFWRLGAIGQSAASAIEMALWDISGKDLDTPVWRLLGGKVRDRVRVYAHLGMGDMNAVYHSFAADPIIEHCAQLRDKGYQAVQLVNAPYSHYLSDSVETDAFANAVFAVREALGASFDIMIDFHGRPPSARTALVYIKAIDPCRPYSVEEPTPPGDTKALAYVREHSSVAIAAGERLIEPSEFEDVLTARAVDVIQPDLCHCGGFTEARRIAQRAELLGIGVAPHNPAGPVACAAALHFAIATPNHLIQEEMTGAAPWFYDLVKQNPIKREAGHWTIPLAPGLGIDIDEAIAAQHPAHTEDLQTRHAVLKDGTIANW